MEKLELINVAKSGDISAKQQLLDDYYPELVRKANVAYQLILEAYKKYYNIKNDNFDFKDDVLDISDVIDEFRVQFEYLLNDYLSGNFKESYQTFMTRGLYEFRNYYVKEKTFSVDKRGEINAKGNLLAITELNPNYQTVLKSYSVKKRNKSVVKFPNYKKIINDTITDLTQFLVKYTDLTMEQITKDINGRINVILEHLNLKEVGFYNQFVEQLQMLKEDYLKDSLGVTWEEKSIKPTIDMLMEKKLKSCSIMKIPYYYGLIQKCIEETQMELSQMITIDNVYVSVEMENKILTQVEEYILSIGVFSISDFEINFNQILENIKSSYIYACLLRSNVAADESSVKPKSFF